MAFLDIMPEKLYDLQLECTAIRACFVPPTELPVLLQPEDFHEKPHAELFRQIMACHQKTGEVNMATVHDLCTMQDWYKNRGSAWLAKLCLDAYFYVPEAEITRILRELRIRRYAQDFKVDLGEARDIIAHFVSNVEEMSSMLPKESVSTFDALQAKTSKEWIPLGFPSLDELVNMRKGNLICIGARTGQGKTSFLCNIACNLSRAGKSVCFLSKEMTVEELAPKFAAYFAQSKSYSDIDRKYFDRIAVHPMRFLDDIERHASITQADVIMVDYIQLVELSKRIENRVAELETITNRLKHIAMTYDKCMVCASQISRETDRTGREPVLADLKGSGSIEQDSNIVIFIHNPALSGEDDENTTRTVARVARDLAGDKGKATFIIAKNRSGQTGRRKLRWNAETGSFLDERAPLLDSSLPF